MKSMGSYMYAFITKKLWRERKCKQKCKTFICTVLNLIVGGTKTGKSM